MGTGEKYRIIHTAPDGNVRVRTVQGLLTKANNIFNTLSKESGKTVFEKIPIGATKWVFVKSREKE